MWSAKMAFMASGSLRFDYLSRADEERKLVPDLSPGFPRGWKL
jgi:hypothetical protein